MAIPMTHFLSNSGAMTQLICHPLSLYILSFTWWVKCLLIVIHFYSYDSFSCVASTFFHGCTIVLTEAVCHDSFLTHFLTHIILHAGRVFWQWHHNHIVCLVIESALHVYKGQFSPWFGQFTYYRNSSPVFIRFNSASVKVQSKCLTSRFGVSKTHGIFIAVLHHHCSYHQLPGPFVTWSNSNQVCTLHTGHMPTN